MAARKDKKRTHLDLIFTSNLMLPSFVTWLKVIDHAKVTTDTRTENPKSENRIALGFFSWSKNLQVGKRQNAWNIYLNVRWVNQIREICKRQNMHNSIDISRGQKNIQQFKIDNTNHNLENLSVSIIFQNECIKSNSL